MIESSYASCRERLLTRLGEPAPGRIQLLTGPRQVGKTTLLLELEAQFSGQSVYAAGDDPDAALPGFWERRWEEAERLAARGTTLLLLDEVHRFPDWAAQLKSFWDRVRRRHTRLHVVASGSSALRLLAGSRESLAGRFERLTLTHWSAADLAGVFGLEPAQAAQEVVAHGGYPGAVKLVQDAARWRAYVLDAIIEPAIGRDVLATGAVRRPALLRQVFALATALPAQIVSLQKLQGELRDRGALETIASYLRLLYDAYLIAPLERYSTRAHRRRAAPPKLIVLDNALITSLHPAGAPTRAQDPARFGAWVENACLAFAVNQAQRVSYWREEPREVDAVCEGSWGDWAIEVKTGEFGSQDLRSLFEFCHRYPKFRPLVLTAPGAEEAARSRGAVAQSWEQFLLSGPPAA
ncbi:MAG: ATP-binding protein [Terriglobales bacterium]